MKSSTSSDVRTNVPVLYDIFACKILGGTISGASCMVMNRVSATPFNPMSWKASLKTSNLSLSSSPPDVPDKAIALARSLGVSLL